VLKRRAARGVTLIEILVALALLALLMFIGAPTMSAFLNSAKIASSAKSFAGALQTARAEAIRRNLPVDLVLTNTPLAGDIANLAAPNAAGVNWVVRVPAQPPAAPGTFDPAIDAKSAQEGSAQTVQVAGTAAVITFNGLGAATPGATFNFTNPAGGACADAAGPMRCQRVVVTPGGQVRLCDPAAAVGDARACPP
jgi:type IV fimbrial biogenesis protein FimT